MLSLSGFSVLGNFCQGSHETLNMTIMPSIEYLLLSVLGTLSIFSCVLTRLLQGERYCPHLRDKQIETQDFSHLLKVVQ